MLGYHALALNDTTARPQLSAKVNLLTYTEDLTNVSWSKTRAVITSGLTDPLGGASANKITDNSSGGSNAVLATRASATLAVSSEWIWSACLKSDQLTMGALRLSSFTSPGNVAAYFNLASGAIMTVGAGLTATISSLGNGWYRCSIKFTLGVSDEIGDLQVLPIQADNNNDVDLDGTSSILCWGADLRPTNIHAAGSVPAYQRVVDAETYDSVGFPYRLITNGTTQAMQTGVITPGSDSVTVGVGIRKLSDAAQAAVMEYTSTSVNNGSLAVFAPESAVANYQYRSKGTVLVQVTSASSYAAPRTGVLAAQSVISSDSALLRENGVQLATSSTDQGAGNYSAGALNLFSRDGGSLWFGGQYFGGIVMFGPQLSAQELATVEAWINSKTKAY